ncbi:MAG: Flp family type IVb pilin [Nitrospirota bacterium]|mgnify:CR=1 FL=1|nr:Flp family type IVb pilin [Nitrospirota bacterium]
MEQVRRIVSEDSGATSVEYALMAGLIAVAIAASVGALGSSLIPIFTNAATGLAGSY